MLDGDPAPSPKGGGALSQFSDHFYCGQTAGWIKMPLGTKVGLSPGDSLLDGDSAPAPLKGHIPPQFSVNVRCGQTAGWTKMPLGMEVDLSPGDFVFDGDLATIEKRAHPPPPIFDPCLLWPILQRHHASDVHSTATATNFQTNLPCLIAFCALSCGVNYFCIEVGVRIISG